MKRFYLAAEPGVREKHRFDGREVFELLLCDGV